MISFFLFGCPDKKNDFTDKVVLIEGTNPPEKISIQVPNDCQKFGDGVKVSIDALVKYSEKELGSLKGNFEKAKIISEYAQRIQTICIAQCNLVRTSTVISTKKSDYDLYSKIVSDYTEYQKIRDLITSNPTESQKNKITDSILEVYEDLYDSKKDELIENAEAVTFTINASVGQNITLYIGDEMIAGTVPDANGIATLTIPQKFMVPKPKEVVKVRIKITSIGFAETNKTFSLGEIVKSSVDKTPLQI